jgi:hypothetical protein
MCASFFQPKAASFNPVDLMKDIIRLVRDVIAIADDFLQLQMLDQLIDFINAGLGDNQNNESPKI